MCVCLGAPVDDGLAVKVLEATADLSSIELHTLLLEPRSSHVVDVKFQISSVHDGQNQTQSVFGFICVC